MFCDLNHRLAAFGSIVWPHAASKSFKSDRREGGYSEIGTIDWPQVQNRKHPLAAGTESHNERLAKRWPTKRTAKENLAKHRGRVVTRQETHFAFFLKRLF